MNNLKIHSLIVLCILIVPVFSQKKSEMTEDRVKVLVNEESEKSESRLLKIQEEQKEILEKKLEFNKNEINQKYNFLTWLVQIVSGLLGLSIIGAVIYIKNYINKKIEREIDFAVYKLDPRRWPIQIPDKNFDTERKRLENLKFINLTTYIGLDVNLKEGITIFRAMNDDDLKRLKTVLDDQKVDPLKSFIVIYYTGKEKLDIRYLAPYENYVLSNMPGTLSNQIFIASRNIV